MPKAAGTSLLQGWRAAFGAANVKTLYELNPADPLSPGCLDSSKSIKAHGINVDNYPVIHGHFKPDLFAPKHCNFYCIFIRHPVDTLLSIFAYWSRTQPNDALHKYFCDSRLSILEMAHLPIIRNLLSETYLSKFDITRFDFIGIHSDLEADFEKMSNILDKRIPMIDANITDSRSETLEGPYQQIRNDRQLRETLASILAKDIELYDAMLAYRKRRGY